MKINKTKKNETKIIMSSLTLVSGATYPQRQRSQMQHNWAEQTINLNFMVYIGGIGPQGKYLECIITAK